jgi:hypothetical protein
MDIYVYYPLILMELLYFRIFFMGPVQLPPNNPQNILLLAEAANILLVSDNDLTTDKDMLKKRNNVVTKILDAIERLLS